MAHREVANSTPAPRRADVRGSSGKGAAMAVLYYALPTTCSVSRTCELGIARLFVGRAFTARLDHVRRHEDQ
jgi:hypothetical protein